MDSKHKKNTLLEMLQIYCQGNHGTKGELCPDCLELLEYAKARTENCPHQPHKPSCSKCTIQCYDKEMQEKMRRIMRYTRPKIPIQFPHHIVSDQ